jgi:hypothetical protein
MDGEMLTGFGPRVGLAVLELNKKINLKSMNNSAEVRFVDTLLTSKTSSLPKMDSFFLV